MLLLAVKEFGQHTYYDAPKPGSGQGSCGIYSIPWYFLSGSVPEEKLL
jgi:hypothetical protein